MSDGGPASAPIAVIIVQRHRVLREAVHRWLRAEPTLQVTAATATAGEAAEVLRAMPGAVVVVDEPVRGESVEVMMNDLLAASATARVVMLVGSRDVSTVSAAITAGATGVLCSDASSESLVSAVKTVACGACVVDEIALRQLVASSTQSGGPALSPREHEVLGLLATGSSNADIAVQLRVSTETVKTHVANVLRKLDAPSRGSAVAAAHRLGLLR